MRGGRSQGCLVLTTEQMGGGNEGDGDGRGRSGILGRGDGIKRFVLDMESLR